MTASHLVAGENVENGNDEEADAGGQENRVEHVALPLSEGGVAIARMFSPGIWCAAAYKFEDVRPPPAYRAHIFPAFPCRNCREIYGRNIAATLMQIKHAIHAIRPRG